MSAILASGISKVFRLHSDRPDSIKQQLLRMGRSKYRDFTALQPLDLDIPAGQTLGILGHNGSGKSTLLKCLSGILKPTTGTIRISGRIASLLELGAGFHPDLTGRENVYINAAFLGISRRDIGRSFDEIVEFSGLEQFIDEPVKHYSSGMYVRLGFAVAVNVDPDILLVDEVLAVGDEVFQRRCLDRVRQFQREGRTIVVVTHNADVVRQVCDRALVLHRGGLIADTVPGEAIRVFRERLRGDLKNDTAAAAVPAATSILQARVRTRTERSYLAPGEGLDVVVDYESSVVVESPMLHLTVDTDAGQTIFALDIDLAAEGLAPLQGRGALMVPVDHVPLLGGNYAATVRLSDSSHPSADALSTGTATFSVSHPSAARGIAAIEVGPVSATGS